MDERKQKTRLNYNVIAPLYTQDFEKDNVGSDLIQEALQILRKQNLSDIKIVDLGTGPGNAIDYLIDNNLLNSFIEGVDFSDTFIEFLKKKYFNKANIKITNSEIVEYINDQIDNTVNMFIANFSIIHIPDEQIDSLFNDIHRVLKNTGLFIMSVHKGTYKGLEEEPYKTLKDSRLKTQGTLQTYMNYFTEDELIQRLSEVGFKIIKIKTIKPVYVDGEMPCDKIWIVVQK